MLIPTVKVKVKKLHPDAVIPTYAKPGDAGVDLVATSRTYEDGNVVYGTGLAVEIAPGNVGLLFPRSSLSKYDLSLCNHVGILDSSYRGEIMLKFTANGKAAVKLTESQLRNYRNLDLKEYEIGDRIGQLIVIPYPVINFQEVEELSTTERGQGGFGHSGT